MKRKPAAIGEKHAKSMWQKSLDMILHRAHVSQFIFDNGIWVLIEQREV